jgi:hypothetical protein
VLRTGQTRVSDQGLPHSSRPCEASSVVSVTGRDWRRRSLTLGETGADWPASHWLQRAASSPRSCFARAPAPEGEPGTREAHWPVAQWKSSALLRRVSLVRIQPSQRWCAVAPSATRDSASRDLRPVALRNKVRCGPVRRLQGQPLMVELGYTSGLDPDGCRCAAWGFESLSADCADARQEHYGPYWYVTG